MSVVTGILASLAVLTSLVLVLVVLLQKPKSGLLSGPLGGTAEVVRTHSAKGVRCFTSVVAALWVLSCLAHALVI